MEHRGRIVFRCRATEPKARNFNRWGAEDGGLRAPRANFGEFLLANTLKDARLPANVTVSPSIWGIPMDMYSSGASRGYDRKEWPALLRLLDRKDHSYRD